MGNAKNNVYGFGKQGLSKDVKQKEILFKEKGAQTWSRDYEVRPSKALHQNETES